MRKIAICTLSCLCTLMLLSACSTSRYRNDVPVDRVMADVQAALSSEAGFHAADGDYLSASAFGDDLDLIRRQVTDWAVALSDCSDTQPDEILIFHASEDAASAVADAVRRHGSSLGQRLRDYYRMYAPREVSKLDNISVKVCGSYVLMTVLDDAQTASAQRAFQTALEQ